MLQLPGALDRGAIPFTPGLYQNDTLPICTVVGLANCARAFSWAISGTDIVVDPVPLKALYSKVVGCQNTDTAIAATDGAVVLDILSAAAHGFDMGQQMPVIPHIEACQGLDVASLAHAALTCGAADLGVRLSISDQYMQVWDTVAPAEAGDPTPGSWGGHDLFLWDWDGLDDTSLVRLGTWGTWQQATWRWVKARVEEAYAVSWRQFLPAS